MSLPYWSDSSLDTSELSRLRFFFFCRDFLHELFPCFLADLFSLRGVFWPESKPLEVPVGAFEKYKHR